MFNFMLNVFQSTLPREERPSIPPATPTIIDFNPRSHERSDSFTTALSMYLTISIHAPTRGATLLQIGSYIIISISIHAPTRGATVSVLSAVAFSVFQSTLPREERPPFTPAAVSIIIFQSTLPREERQHPQCHLLSQVYFNPRSHERSDLSSTLIILLS